MQHITRTLIFFVAIGIALPFFAHAQVNVVRESVPNNVTLVWEAQTYVPPFYKGKALNVDGADVNILAYPPADFGDPAALVYEWKVNGTVQESASGLGRRFFVFQPDIFGGNPSIIVTVYREGQRLGLGAIRVPQVKPSVIMYPALPLSGILFGSAITAIKGDEITLESYPLFFSVKTKVDPALMYTWKVNGEYSQNPLGNSGRLVLRSEKEGQVGVEIGVSNAKNILETAKNNLILTFEE